MGREQRAVAPNPPGGDLGDELAQVLVVGEELPLPATVDERRHGALRKRRDQRAEETAGTHAEDQAGTQRDAVALSDGALQSELRAPIL
jgi:hypothetical protein